MPTLASIHSEEELQLLLDGKAEKYLALEPSLTSVGTGTIVKNGVHKSAYKYQFDCCPAVVHVGTDCTPGDHKWKGRIKSVCHDRNYPVERPRPRPASRLASSPTPNHSLRFATTTSRRAAS